MADSDVCFQFTETENRRKRKQEISSDLPNDAVYYEAFIPALQNYDQSREF